MKEMLTEVEKLKVTRCIIVVSGKMKEYEIKN